MNKLLLCIFSFLFFQHSFSQNIGIGTEHPDPNAMLDISSNSKGLLIPRMDSTSRKQIPATKGMMVYDTSTHNFWYNDGIEWLTFQPKGNRPGEMLFWNGNSWTALPQGQPGQYLSLSPDGDGLIPTWSTINVGGISSNIATINVSNVGPTTAVSGGNITTDNGISITERGIVWNTLPNPTIALPTKTNDGSGIGYFTSNMNGLEPANTYYVRAYQVTANGVTYGNEVSFSTVSAFTIGQEYQGGLIAYIEPNGQHGFVVSPQDLSTGITWNYFDDIETGADNVAIGDGFDNTDRIIEEQGAGSYAASLCRDFYNGGGYTDWYLPSLYELNQLFLQKEILDISSGGGYWSSSEIDTYTAWIIDFGASGPNQIQYTKNNTVSVRAIRKF